MNDVLNTSDARCFSRSDSRARERGVKMTASATRFSFTATKWAVVCELIHSASLLHDDICDEDTMRRGKTAVWKKFGVPAAICSGDYLIAESFRKLTEIEQGWHQNILLKLLSNSVKAIVFGQSFDVSAQHLKICKKQYKGWRYSAAWSRSWRRRCCQGACRRGRNCARKPE